MKQFLLLLCCCLSIAVSAQRTLVPGTATKPAINGSERVMEFPEIAPVLPGQRLVLDTFFSPVFNQQCAAAPGLIGTTAGGFVTGTNGFIDIAKLQRIIFPESYDFDLTTVSAALILDSIASTDNLLDDVMIVAKVYADNEDGTVGEFLGDSDSLRIGDLPITDSTFSFVDFNFSTPVSFSETESIIVGVDFINVYSVNDGNIGIISTRSDCGDGTNAFDVFLDSLNNEVFATIFDSWGGLDIEMYISVVIDREPAVATRDPLADYGAIVAPNPVAEELNITFTTPGIDPVTASLLSTDGRVLRTKTTAAGPGFRSVQWNVAELPSGVYLYRIAGNQGIQTGRVIVH